MKNDNKKKISTVIMFYSKFFGLYKKQSMNFELKDEDFDLKYIATDTQQHSLTEALPSNLKESIIESAHMQQDRYNCGIHAILECISSLIGTSKGQYISDNYQQNDIDKYRLNILYLISKVYDLYNCENYTKCKEHIYINDNIPITKDCLKKWTFIHELYNNGKIKYDILNNENANNTFNKFSIGTLKKKYLKTTSNATTVTVQKKKMKL